MDEKPSKPSSSPNTSSVKPQQSQQPVQRITSPRAQQMYVPHSYMTNRCFSDLLQTQDYEVPQEDFGWSAQKQIPSYLDEPPPSHVAQAYGTSSYPNYDSESTQPRFAIFWIVKLLAK